MRTAQVIVTGKIRRVLYTVTLRMTGDPPNTIELERF